MSRWHSHSWLCGVRCPFERSPRPIPGGPDAGAAIGRPKKLQDYLLGKSKWATYRDVRRALTSMTIAVGFGTPYGVVLCADRQLTKEGGLKFQANKILWRTSLHTERFYNLIFTYSGDPDAAQSLFNAVSKAVIITADRVPLDDDFWEHYLEQAIKFVLKSREAKYVQTLIGVQTSRGCTLFRTKGNRIFKGVGEYIGSGDSSVVRYIADVTSLPILSIEEAKVLAIYMVSLANRYIDGCGFGMDAAIIAPKKPITILSKRETAQYSRYFSRFERRIPNDLFDRKKRFGQTLASK
jgi:hypothetical protein